MLTLRHSFETARVVALAAAVCTSSTGRTSAQQSDRRNDVRGALLTLLQDRTANASAQEAAIGSLKLMGATDRETIQVLCAVLAAPEPDVEREGGLGVRDVAVFGLEKLGADDPATIDALRQTVQSESADHLLKAYAAGALATLNRRTEARTALLAILRDQGAPVEARAATVSVLERSRFDDEQSVGALREILSDTKVDSQIRIRTTWTLSQLTGKDGATVGVLQDVLSDAQDDVFVRQAAANALVNFGANDTATLQILRSTLFNWRIRAADALRKLGANDRETLTALRLVLLDSSRESRARSDAARVLSELARADDDLTVAAFRNTLRDQSADSNVKASAARGLTQLDSTDEETLSALRDTMSNIAERDWARVATAGALTQLSESDEAPLEFLRDVLRDSKTGFPPRSQAAEHLGNRSGDEATLDCLRQVISNRREQSFVRQSAIEAIGTLQATDRDTLDVLRHVVSDPDDNSLFVRTPAIEVLMDLADTDRATIVALEAALSDAFCQDEAATALGRLASGNEQVIEELRSILADTSADAVLRGGAAEALGKMEANDDATIRALCDCLKSPGDESIWLIRLPAVEALRRVGRHHDVAVETLLSLLAVNSGEEDAEWLVIDAVHALGKIFRVEE